MAQSVLFGVTAPSEEPPPPRTPSPHRLSTSWLDGSFLPDESMDPSERSRDKTDVPAEPVEQESHGLGPEQERILLHRLDDKNEDHQEAPLTTTLSSSSAVVKQEEHLQCQGSRVPPPSPPDVHLVIAGVAKRPNVIALLQLALAFGVTTVLVSGQEKNLGDVSALPSVLQQQLLFVQPSSLDCNSEDPDDCNSSSSRRHDKQSHLKLIRFRKWRNLVEYLKEHGIPLVGVEIHPNALSVSELLDKYMGGRRIGDGSADTRFEASDEPPHRSFALVMGNEGDGLSQAQMDACDDFVRIPQYGTGTASLNVAVAASIVLHECHMHRMSLLDEYDGAAAAARGGDVETNANDLHRT